MELIDRYLNAVKLWLPENLRDDLLPELEDDLRSQIEEREQAAGQALNEAEISEILKKRGHPLLVATRLLPQQHLIGPRWYPVWRLALRIIVVWILAPLFILILAPLAAISSSSPFSAFVDTAMKLPGGALYALAWITLAVAVLERLQIEVKILQDWNPANLPPAHVTEKPLSRCEAVFEMAAGSLFLLWWVGIVQAGDVPEIDVKLAPIWVTLFWPILVVETCFVAFATAKLLSPYWRPVYSIASLAIQFVTLGLTIALLNVSPLVTVEGAGASAAKLANLSGILEVTVQITLAVIGVSAVVTILSEIRRLKGVSKKKNGALVRSHAAVL